MKLVQLIKSICALGLSLSALPAIAQAQYPDRPIKLVVPYAPGGTVDVFARILQPKLEAKLGKPVIIENVPGAGGTIGVARVAKAAKPDGYTILLGIVSDVVIAPLTEVNTNYSYRDLEAIAPLGTSGIGLVAKPDLGIRSFDDLIAYARKNPGKLAYGATGAGSLPALAMEDLKRRANIDIQFVPYTSAAKIAQDALGGHLDIAVSGLPALLEYIRTGNLSAVGVMSRDRDIGNPDMQSASESKELLGMDFYFWTGLFAPKGTPEPIVSKLNASFLAALREPATEERFKEFGVKISPTSTPAEYAKFVAASHDSWATIVEANKKKP
ncbi:Bug family tripartite tricarboxylate transporter substrate binding protein [Bradyrhizobium sp. 195]|uniref:Bug family tripartite tricarboxylate transporter substrate binding protein n=1 Tax=Bradyrhizobium sp. 195 TaxID=2782662 RepID=UPI002001965B|nr:tripartite tricarboxylate transporter substrate binding protein [Bradyrhizobium sp. 195]UPK29202.1 tripartite tricarboxylate transporter substrate binding protein [Bradyrhizobium sp. 195]